MHEASVVRVLPHSTASSSNQVAQRITPEAALPSGLLNLIELFMLEGSGEVVQWPDGISFPIAYQIIIDFFSPMIEQSTFTPAGVGVASVLDPAGAASLASPITPAPLPVCSPDNFCRNLTDLLDLYDVVEPVEWPPEFDLMVAHQTVLDYRHVVSFLPSLSDPPNG